MLPKLNFHTLVYQQIVCKKMVLGQFGTRTIWHRGQFGTKSVNGQFGTADNLAPRVKNGQFGTADNLAPRTIWHQELKRTIWHRGQFGTKSVKRTIWHQELKTDNLAPRVYRPWGTPHHPSQIWQNSPGPVRAPIHKTKCTRPKRLADKDQYKECC